MQKTISRFKLLAALSICAPLASASLSTGPGGSGVTVGQSGLISTLDYSDTFTGTDAGGQPNRPFVPAVQPAPAYVVENTYGNSSQNFHSPGLAAGVGNFSFASDTNGLVNGSPNYPGSSGAGSDTGITQTGGNVDFGLLYGLRSRYLVQVDAVASGDRVDITSGPAAEGIFQANSLSIFFRATGGVSLFNGTTDTPVPGYDTGLTGGGSWHNYAALFDQNAKTVELFVDEQSTGVIDLNTVAGGLYGNFSNGAVGAGEGLAGGENRSWLDNFQVGAPADVPEPGMIGVVGLMGVGALLRRRPSR
jgi:hypothetical protein